MGYSIWQDVEVTTTVVVRDLTGARRHETTWQIQAAAENRSSTVAGMERAVAEALDAAARDAREFAATLGSQLQRAGAHPANPEETTTTRPEGER